MMPTANQDPEGEGNAFVDVFRRVYGVNATYIPVTRTSGNVDDPDVAELVRQQTGIFFVGGNRPRVLYPLIPDGRDSLVMTAIRRVLRDGGVVAGTSAGMCSLVRTPIAHHPFRYRRKFDDESPIYRDSYIGMEYRQIEV